MNRRNLIPAILLSLTVTFTSSGCCEGVLVFCDLIAETFTTPDQITLGSAFDMLGDIFNADSDDECETGDFADATLSLVEVFFDELGDGNWAKIADNSYDQASIAPDDYYNFLESVTLNQAGFYRFDYYTDSPNNVPERNENNNANSDNSGGRVGVDREALQATNNYSYSYTKVLPLPDGTTKIAGKPIVEFH